MSDRSCFGKPLWTATASTQEEFIFVPPGLDAEVAIIGGGVHGMSAVLHLAEAGISAVLLDAGSANGRDAASVASGGLIAPQLVRGSPNTIINEYADGGGGRLVQLVAKAGKATFELIARHGLACDAQNSGFLAPFRAQQREHSERSVREWRAFRADMEIIDAAEVEHLTGCIGYAGALIDQSGGSVNPASYAREMGRRATEFGAKVFYGARVEHIKRGDKTIVLGTNQGDVVVRKVVLAANGGNMALHRSLARTVLPLDVGEVATVPLPLEMRSTVLPHNHSMTDRGPDIFTIRYDSAGRLVTSMTMPWARSLRTIERAVNARLKRYIPTWRDTRLDYIWSGRAWLSSDLTPRFVAVEKNILAVQACNGRGIALAAPIGREILRWIKDPDCELGLPVIVPKPINGYQVARHLPNIALRLASVKGRLHL